MSDKKNQTILPIEEEKIEIDISNSQQEADQASLKEATPQNNLKTASSLPEAP
jgi:hypothetical protein